MADDDTGMLAKVDAVAPEGWRKHVAAILFQLGLGTQKTAAVYAKGREAIDIADGRALVSKALAQAVANQAIADPDMMERAKARFLSEAFTKQDNLEAVLQIAEQRLLADSSAMDRGSGDRVADADESPRPLDPDWAATFTREAESATSEELRTRLAKILAGEVSQPGSVSRSTVRMIAELDQEVLQNLEKVIPYIVNNGIMVDESWRSGEYFSLGISLEDAGLVNGVVGSTQKILKIPEGGVIAFGANDGCLLFHGPVGLDKQINCWLLTKPGREVVKLMSDKVTHVGLRMAAKEIDKAGLTKIDLGRIITGERGQEVEVIETLWQSHG